MYSHRHNSHIMQWYGATDCDLHTFSDAAQTELWEGACRAHLVELSGLLQEGALKVLLVHIRPQVHEHLRGAPGICQTVYSPSCGFTRMCRTAMVCDINSPQHLRSARSMRINVQHPAFVRPVTAHPALLMKSMPSNGLQGRQRSAPLQNDNMGTRTRIAHCAEGSRPHGD